MDYKILKEFQEMCCYETCGRHSIAVIVEKGVAMTQANESVNVINRIKAFSQPGSAGSNP